MSTELPARWQSDVPLARLTTWRIGGPARYLSHPRDPAELREDLKIARQRSLPVLALGSGSNVLFPDRGYDGLLVRLAPLAARFPAAQELAPAGILHLRVAAGIPLARVARAAATRGWGGLEWAEGIPGTLGGAIVNNAGAYGGDMAQALDEVELMHPDGSQENWPTARLALAYRGSVLKGADPTRHFITAARLHLSRAPVAEMRRRLREFRTRRIATTPHGASCGCVFRNPPGRSAGRTIAESGLAGVRVGGALVSPQHANYILNVDRATAHDVLALIALVQREVEARAGVRLELEVQRVGFGDELPGQASQ